MKYLAGMAFLFLTSSLFAAGGGAAPAYNPTNVWIAITAGLGIALASAVGALSQAKVVHRASEAISRNPGTAPHIRFALILGLVLIESLVIYSLLIEILLVGKLKF